MGQTTSQVAQSPRSEPISTANWFDLPLEMRVMIIDEMDAKTRCIFARCSKICEIEAKSSMNYLQGITVTNPYTLELSPTDKIAYKMKFLEMKENRTLVVYVGYKDGDKNDRDVKWTKVENGKSSEVRLKYFEEFTKMYKRSIKYLKIDDKTFSLLDHNLKHLRFIQEIEISHEDVFKCGYLNLNQISLSDDVSLEGTNFTFEQVTKLEGVFYSIRSDEFDEKGIIKYLKMWKDGELPKYLYHISVRIPYPVNIQNIMEELDVFYYDLDENECMFRFYASHQIDTLLCTQVYYIFPTLLIWFNEEELEDYDDEDSDSDDNDEDNDFIGDDENE